MENFAKNHMQQYGWVKGKGLGLNEDGISEPIKVKLKADTCGLGHDICQQYTYHWWDHAFKCASTNIRISENENGVEVATNAGSKIASTKKSLKKIISKNVVYGKFVKSGVLNNGILEKVVIDSSDAESSEDEDFKEHLTDEQLLKACGGRTAHKGARHGLKLSGKLARLAEQEKNAISSTEGELKKEKMYKNNQRNEEKTKRKKKVNETCQNSLDAGIGLKNNKCSDAVAEEGSSNNINSSNKMKMKSKKRKRSENLMSDIEIKHIKNSKDF